MEYTLAIIKPDAVRARNSGKIIDAIEAQGFNIVRMEKRTLSQQEGKDFYAVHKSRPFYGELVDFMSSGPVVVMALEKNNAVTAWRELMGATNPKDAAEGTIRKKFAKDIGENAVHGSDSADNAAIELKFFFPDL
jgi:nucleoside-diphosphate kinase